MVLVDRRTLALAWWALNRLNDTDNGSGPLIATEADEAERQLEDALAAAAPMACNIGARLHVRHQVIKEQARAMRRFHEDRRRQLFKRMVNDAAWDLEQHRAICGRCGAAEDEDRGADDRALACDEPGPVGNGLPDIVSALTEVPPC